MGRIQSLFFFRNKLESNTYDAQCPQQDEGGVVAREERHGVYKMFMPN
jgi:hypothetical protein